MIRLLRLSLPRLGLAGSQRSFFSSKKLFKNAKNHTQTPLRSGPIAKDKRQDKYASVKGQALRETAQEIDKKWQIENAGRTFFALIDQLFTKEQLQLVKSKLGSQQATLKQKMAVIDSQKKPQIKAQAEFEMLRIIIPGMMDAQIEISEELLRYILERYYCSYFLMSYTKDHPQDSVTLQFLDKYKQGVEEYLRTTPIKYKLRFLYFLKGLAARRVHSGAYRPIIHSFNSFFYPLIESDFQAIDFSSWNGNAVLQLFTKIIDEHLLTSYDSKLIAAVSTQVPFFAPSNILRFLIDFPVIIDKADKGTVMAILEVLELDRFSEAKPSQYLGYIQAFGRLARSHAQVGNKIQHLLHLFLSRLLEKRSKDGNISLPHGLLFELLADISKQITLDGQSEQSRILFTYFRFLVEGLTRLSLEDFHRQCNVLFEILAIVTGNRFLRRSTFAKEFASLESSLQRVTSKRSKARSTYLWKFLKNKSQKLEICNVGWLLQLSSHKQASLVQQIIATDDPELAKSLMLMLVDAQCKEAPLLSLRALLPEFTFQQILTKLNLSLLRLQQPESLLAIFGEVVMRQDFNDLAIELLQNLHGLPGVNGQQILQLFIEAVLRRTSGPGAKKTLSSFLLVLQFYINSLKLAKKILSCPGFYYLLSRMLGIQAGTSDVSEFNINIYRILIFIFDETNFPMVIDSLIEYSLRHLSFSHEGLERLKQFIAINVLERQIIMFKLDHVVPASEVEGIYAKLQRLSRAPARQRALINKLHNPAYLPEGPPNMDNLVVFLIDQNGPALLQPHLETAKEIIAKSTVKERAILLYNCKASSKMLSSEIFIYLWHSFLDKLEDPRQIICLYLLQKYGRTMSQQLVMPLLIKLLQFYANHLELFTTTQHLFLLHFIKQQFTRKDLSQDVRLYVSNLHRFMLQSNLSATNSNSSRAKILLQILSLSFPLQQSELRQVKPKLLEEQLAFYTLITHEETFGPQRMEALLKEYLETRAKMKQLDLPEVDFYIQLKYPQLTALLATPQGSKMPFHLKEHCERQYNIMNRLQRRYKDLAFKDRSFFFTNQSHLLAFCTKENRHYEQFRYKYFMAEPLASHLKAHLFDFSEIDQANFFDRLEAEGIVSPPIKPKISANESSAAQKLAQEIAEARARPHPDSTKD